MLGGTGGAGGGGGEVGRGGGGAGPLELLKKATTIKASRFSKNKLGL